MLAPHMEMDATELKTAKAPQGEEVKQFSVFMENKVGRLLDIVKMFSQAQRPRRRPQHPRHRRRRHRPPRRRRPRQGPRPIPGTRPRLHRSPLLVVELSSSAADLKAVLTALLQAECNIHSAYSLLTRPRGKAALALHVEDRECATAVLQANPSSSSPSATSAGSCLRHG
jgi:hypothetical protein